MRSVHLLLAASLLAACSARDGLPPTPADQVPEASFDAPSLAEALARTDRLPALEAPFGASRIAAHVHLEAAGAAAPALEARGVDAEGSAGAWRPLTVTWREGAQLVAVVDLEEVTFRAELRVAPEARGAITLLTWSAAIPEPPREAAPGDVGARRAALRADIAALGVMSREQWGARATRCTSGDSSKYRIAIHHTVTNPMGDPAANLRGIQAFHMDGRGWCDVGYHFLVSIDGQVWEGRPVQLLGAHVGGHNTGNIGVSFIGCFHTSSCDSLPPQVPPDVMIDGGARFVAGIAGIYGIGISATSVKGHRDHSGATTACPGDHLHARLDDLRSGSAGGPAWAASYVAQSFPLARDPFELAPDEVEPGYLEMRNDGTETWRPGEVFLGTTQPRDVASPIAGPDWVSSGRAATIDRVVAPGESGRFMFSVRAPSAPGDYPQFFSLLREGVAWFSDPGQGGPPDDLIQIRVTTLDVPPVMADAGPPPPMPDASVPPPMDAGPPIPGADAGPPAPRVDAGMGTPLESGCGCRTVGAPRGAPAWGALLMLGLVLRRRRLR